MRASALGTIQRRILVSDHPPHFWETLAVVGAHKDSYEGRFWRAVTRSQSAQSLKRVVLHFKGKMFEFGEGRGPVRARAYPAKALLTASYAISPPPPLSEDLSARFSTRDRRVFRETTTLRTKEV